VSGFSCVIINEGTAASPLTASVTAAWLARCAQACATQLLRDAAPIWGRAVTAVRAGSGPTDIQAGEIVFALLDSLPDAPGAIAYHDVNGAEVPVAFLGLQTCKTLDDISSAVSHELLETLGDEGCNRWVDDGKGAEWALELCDAVESNSYPIDIGDGQPPIMVSDFLLPAFFCAGTAAPYNFMAIPGNPVVPTSAVAAPAGPFATAAGGYQITRQSGGGETQVTGSVRAARAAKMAHWSSRPSRRGARASGHAGPPPPAPTMLGRSHDAMAEANGVLKAAFRKAKNDHPDSRDLHDMLRGAGAALSEAQHHLHDHLDAAAAARNSAVLQSMGFGAMFAGHLWGLVQAMPKEPGPGRVASLLDSISPETKASAARLVTQIGQALQAMLYAQTASAGKPPPGDPPQ
jgi:hypothetical protein